MSASPSSSHLNLNTTFQSYNPIYPTSSPTPASGTPSPESSPRRTDSSSSSSTSSFNTSSSSSSSTQTPVVVVQLHEDEPVYGNPLLRTIKNCWTAKNFEPAKTFITDKWDSSKKNIRSCDSTLKVAIATVAVAGAIILAPATILGSAAATYLLSDDINNVLEPVIEKIKDLVKWDERSLWVKGAIFATAITCAVVLVAINPVVVISAGVGMTAGYALGRYRTYDNYLSDELAKIPGVAKKFCSDVRNAFNAREAQRTQQNNGTRVPSSIEIGIDTNASTINSTVIVDPTSTQTQTENSTL